MTCEENSRSRQRRQNSKHSSHPIQTPSIEINQHIPYAATANTQVRAEAESGIDDGFCAHLDHQPNSSTLMTKDSLNKHIQDIDIEELI